MPPPLNFMLPQLFQSMVGLNNFPGLKKQRPVRVLPSVSAVDVQLPDHEQSSTFLLEYITFLYNLIAHLQQKAL